MGHIKTSVIGVAKKIPRVNSYLQEKEQLYLRSVKLEQTVDALKRQNQQLRERLEEGPANLLGDNWKRLTVDLINTKASTKPVLFKAKPPFTINWVMPMPIKGSGGQADIYRTISFLEQRQHKNRIYFYDPTGTSVLKAAKESVKNDFTSVDAELFYNEDPSNFKPADITFATNWVSAYPVAAVKKKTNKYYYVQDLESLFMANSSMSVAAENTYKMGFRGITLGSWLSNELSKAYGMECEYFNFGFNPEEYFLRQEELMPRNKIAFYTRPRTPRRGFELGILALEIFHRRNPKYKICFFGAEDINANIPFPFENLGILNASKLNQLYNECSAGLTISLTNMSLIPIEMIAAGCTPIVNKADFTEHVAYSEDVMYSEPDPQSIAQSLEAAVKNRSDREAAKKAERVKEYTWESSNKRIEQILRKDLS